MSQVIQFPTQFDRHWSEISEGLHSGLGSRGFSAKEIGRIEALMRPAWESVFSRIESNEISLRDLQVAVYREFLCLAIQVERGRA